MDNRAYLLHVQDAIVWDTVQNDLPKLKQTVDRLLAEAK